jgi:hypothetical protein
VKVSTRHGRLRLLLERQEITLLDALLDEVAAVLTEEDADDPVVARLYPAAYRQDEPAAAEYRSLTESTLRSERLQRVAACAGELDREIDLSDPEVSRRWIQVLNDLRLALGTRLGVTEDDRPSIDPANPDDQPWLVYYWLTAVQDAVVSALMG